MWTSVCNQSHDTLYFLGYPLCGKCVIHCHLNFASLSSECIFRFPRLLGTPAVISTVIPLCHNRCAALTSGRGQVCDGFHMVGSCWLHAFVSKVSQQKSVPKVIKGSCYEAWSQSLCLQIRSHRLIVKSSKEPCLSFILLHCNHVNFFISSRPGA